LSRSALRSFFEDGAVEGGEEDGLVAVVVGMALARRS